jgi:hypothetical protein
MTSAAWERVGRTMQVNCGSTRVAFHLALSQGLRNRLRLVDGGAGNAPWRFGLAPTVYHHQASACILDRFTL